jgi:hypothetical protein
MDTMLKLQAFSGNDFARYGIMTTAYVKPTRAANKVFYAVHAADGTFLHQYCDHATACAAVRQHDLEPATVH